MNAWNERRSDPENSGEGIIRFGVVVEKIWLGPFWNYFSIPGA
jgi:hypothetical protein